MRTVPDAPPSRGFWRAPTIDGFAGAALSILRIAAAVELICPGAMKLFGWFAGIPGHPGGGGLPARLMVAGWLEVAGGFAILPGFLTRPVAFIASGETAFAYFLGHFPRGFWPISNHGEPAVLLCFIFLFISASGPEPLSLDHLIRRRRAAEGQS